METAEPKKIYLQIGEDDDIDEFEKSDFETNAITWCWERIFKNDIEYISKSAILALVDDMVGIRTGQIQSNRLTINGLAGLNMSIVTLNELRQKIVKVI